MSRDIFVQDVPDGVVSVDDIPEGWEPQPLPFGQASVVQAVLEVAPTADVSEPSWVRVSLPGVDVEVSCDDESPLRGFALHVRGADQKAADTLIKALLERLGVRVFDPESETGLFVG